MTIPPVQQQSTQTKPGKRDTSRSVTSGEFGRTLSAARDTSQRHGGTGLPPLNRKGNPAAAIPAQRTNSPAAPARPSPQEWLRLGGKAAVQRQASGAAAPAAPAQRAAASASTPPTQTAQTGPVSAAVQADRAARSVQRERATPIAVDPAANPNEPRSGNAGDAPLGVESVLVEAPVPLAAYAVPSSASPADSLNVAGPDSTADVGDGDAGVTGAAPNTTDATASTQLLGSAPAVPESSGRYFKSALLNADVPQLIPAGSATAGTGAWGTQPASADDTAAAAAAAVSNQSGTLPAAGAGTAVTGPLTEAAPAVGGAGQSSQRHAAQVAAVPGELPLGEPAQSAVRTGQAQSAGTAVPDAAVTVDPLVSAESADEVAGIRTGLPGDQRVAGPVAVDGTAAPDASAGGSRVSAWSSPSAPISPISPALDASAVGDRESVLQMPQPTPVTFSRTEIPPAEQQLLSDIRRVQEAADPAQTAASRLDVGASTGQAANAAASSRVLPTAAPSAHVSPTMVVPQLIPALRSLRALADGRHEMTIRIDPDHLGPVRLTATIRGDAVHVELHAATALGSDLLRHSLDDLRREFTSSSLTTTLDLGADSAGQAAQRSDERASERDQDRLRAEENAESPSGAALADEVGTGDLERGTSSVNIVV